LGYRLRGYGIALTAENSNPEFDKLIGEERGLAIKSNAEFSCGKRGGF